VHAGPATAEAHVKWEPYRCRGLLRRGVLRTRGMRRQRPPMGDAMPGAAVHGQDARAARDETGAAARKGKPSRATTSFRGGTDCRTLSRGHWVADHLASCGTRMRLP